MLSDSLCPTPTLRAVIEGKECRLLLDTGDSGGLAIYATEQPAGELKEVERINILGTVRKHKYAKRAVPIQIGQPAQTIVENVQYIAPDESAHAEAPDGLQGIVGWGWLSKFGSVTLDLGAGEILLMPEGTPLDEVEPGGVELPLLPTADDEQPRWPVVKVQLGDWQGPAVLDTGLNSDGPILVVFTARSLAERQEWIGKETIRTAGRVAGRQEIEATASRCQHDLVIAGVVFRQPVIPLLDQWAVGQAVLGDDAPKDEVIVIGAEILRHFKIRFFPKQKRAIFYRPPDAPVVVEQPPMRTLGLEGKGKTGNISITRVLPDSNADKAGLRAGDVVVKINGKGEDLTPEDLYRWTQSDEKLEFVIQRDGQELTLRFRPTVILSE